MPRSNPHTSILLDQGAPTASTFCHGAMPIQHAGRQLAHRAAGLLAAFSTEKRMRRGLFFPQRFQLRPSPSEFNPTRPAKAIRLLASSSFAFSFSMALRLAHRWRNRR